MRFRDLRSASSFRLALFFAALFGSASLLFVGTTYTLTTSFLSGNPDERMRAQAISFDARSPHNAEEMIDQHGLLDPAGRRPFGLFAPDGRWIAGNLKKLPNSLPRPERFFETKVKAGGEDTIYRSFLHRLPNGRIVIVSRNIEELAQFRQRLLDVTVIGLLLMALLGIAGGTIIGLASLRRLDGVTLAIESITRGDLSRRLPARGSNDDIDRLVRVVNSMLDQIQRLMGEVKGVCDSVAHDLRTPLTRLLAILERAHRHNLSADEREIELCNASQEVQQMLRTFAALLRISEMEDGIRRASFREIDLAQLVEDVVDYYEPAAETKGIDLLFNPDLTDMPKLISADADLMFEALGNLLDNAIKFTPESGSIRVELAEGPSVIVTDTGPGIAPEERGQVAIRFHRGTRSRGTPGNGLGLPLVNAIARLHGMELRIEDHVGGCRVALATLPLSLSSSIPAQGGLNRINLASRTAAETLAIPS